MFKQLKKIHLSSEAPIDESHLEDLESKIGFKLPQDYREFMLQHNGGEVQASASEPLHSSLVFRVPEFDGRGKYVFDVASFLSISTNEGDYGLFEVYTVLVESWCVPRTCLPIAVTAGNLKIFLSLDGERAGHVVLAGSRYTAKVDSGETVLLEDFISIAPSFTDFVNQLEWTSEAET